MVEDQTGVREEDWVAMMCPLGRGAYALSEGRLTTTLRVRLVLLRSVQDAFSALQTGFDGHCGAAGSGRRALVQSGGETFDMHNVAGHVARECVGAQQSARVSAW